MPPKNTRPTPTTKNNKLAPENVSEQRPEEEKNCKETAKDTERDRTKERTAFPPSRRGKTATGTRQSVTVRLPCVIVPDPLPGLSFTAFGSGVGGATTDLIGIANRDSVARPYPRDNRNDNDKEGGDDCLPPSKVKTVHYTFCMQCRKTDTTSRTTREHPNQKDKRRRRTRERAGAGHGLGEGEHEGERIEVGVRVQDEESLGEPQTPKGGLGFPSAWERKKEKEAKRRRRHRPNKRKEIERRQPTSWQQGSDPKGRKIRQQSNLRDKNNTHNNSQHGSRKNPTLNLTQTQQSLRGYVTAG